MNANANFAKLNEFKQICKATPALALLWKEVALCALRLMLSRYESAIKALEGQEKTNADLTDFHQRQQAFERAHSDLTNKCLEMSIYLVAIEVEEICALYK